MDIITILNIMVIVLVVVIIALVVAYYFLIYRKKDSKKEKELKETKKNASTFNGISKEDIKTLLDFDEIKDDMIIRKNGDQYVMAIQCKGINYDLLSDEEKLSVEAGFVQFLNTLRFPIQLYVQARSLNLKNIVDEYKVRVNSIAEEIKELENQRKEAVKEGNTEKEERIAFDIKRKQNVLEYGTDISEYIGKMSLNKNVLQQKTYVIVSYFASEIGNTSNYSKEEIRNICFSELYTRCQSIIRTLAASQVYGRVLESEELAELLYIAYNRDDSELYQLSKALDAEYDALYTTGKDVLVKKQEKIEEELEVEAVDLATDSIMAADRRLKDEKERKAKIREKAVEIVDEYKDQLDPELYKATKQEILNSGRKTKNTEESEAKPRAKTTRARKKA